MSDCINIEDIPAHIASRNDLDLAEKIELSIANLTDKAVQGILDGMTSQKIIIDIMKADSPENALIDMLRPLRNNLPGNETGKITLEFRQDQIRNEAHLMMYNTMSDLRPGISDLWTKQNSESLIRTLFGEKVNDVKAAQYAKEWDKTYSYMEGLYIKAGGHLQLDRYHRIPVSHDAHKMSAEPYEVWKEFLSGKLANDAINKDNYDKVLRDIYDEQIHAAVSIPNDRYKVSELRSETDGIVFKDAESWLAYNDAYGTSKLYDSMQDQVTSMAHLVGAMEVFGSKPKIGYEMVKKAIAKSTENTTTARLKTKKALARADKIFDTSMGHLRSSDYWARGIGSIRNIQTGLKLGGAIIPAITDTTLMAVTSHFIGMPVFKSITRHISSIAGGADKQMLSARLLLGLEHMMDVSHSTSRYTNIYGSKASAKFAGGTLKWSGLQGWTIGAKQSFGIEMNAYLTKAIMKPEEFKTARILKMYGFSDSDIGALQKAERFSNNGVDFIDPMSLPQELRRKWSGMMLTETKMAVPEADAGVQALLNQGQAQGTFVGESLRLGTQFKMFPATIIANHWARALNQTKGVEKHIYIANMVLGTTMIGVLAIQAKQIINGEEPQTFGDDPKKNADLLFKGFVQGGSGSFVADLFGSYINYGRYGQDTLGKQILGPALGDVSNLFSLVFADIPRSINGDPNFPGLDSTSAKLLESQMPNLWQTKLLLRRGIIDQLNKASDPRWEYKQIKKQQKMKLEEDRGYWSNPGDFPGAN